MSCSPTMVIGSAQADDIARSPLKRHHKGSQAAIEPGINKGLIQMCRNIRTLFNFEPRATEDEIRASALQYVRKLSGFAKPSRANEAAFNQAVDEVTEVAR